ncbi:MAG TPA: type I DNA topoisomerase, partial [Herpetosiphonaceae bacterium]|nr:type I DNA topoisomerase [Herpetosiphonaceae bacterium]
MAQKLVIVESPAKAKTIEKYLGPGYRVRASMGHVRDLPKSKLGVDMEHDFAPAYEISEGKQKVIKELQSAVRTASEIYLATDPDREGEAIAWHVREALKIPKNKPVHRVTFQEITKNAVKEAISHPRILDQHLIDAQQARRVLDRLVGYRLSPLLWDKVRRGLSAGRVQSVAVRLVVEREREIEQFRPQEYWTIEADLAKLTPKAQKFRAVLIERAGKKLGKFAIENKAAADQIRQELDGAAYAVRSITRKDKKRAAAPPFTTSTLQQEAARKLGMSAKTTMRVAQQLYEGVDVGGSEGTVGLITYMRTDSLNVSREAQAEARALIGERYGAEYVPQRPNTYKTRAKGAQEAHEAIRPTSSRRLPEQVRAALSRDQFRLYDLVWKRFIASQMAPAVFDSSTVDIGAGREVKANIARDAAVPFLFRATGSVLRFPGFLAVY